MARYETREAIAKLTDPEFAELLKASQKGAASGAGGSLEANAAIFAALSRENLPATDTDALLDIPMRDGRLAWARVYKSSKPSSGPSPLVVLVHGGGFVLGDPTHVALTGKSIAEATGAVVVAPSYRLAPKHTFPAAPEDIWDALNWLAQPANATSLGADISAGLVLGGVSAGGNLAAAAAQRCVTDGNSHGLTGVLLIVPHVLEQEIVPEKYKDAYFSREQNAAAVIDKAALDFVERTVNFDKTSPLFSPFNAPTPHVGMPPVYIQVAGQDAMRDDGLVYERVLREHGVKTLLDVYPGVPHAHAFMFPTLKTAEKAHVDLVKGAAWLLGKDVGHEQAASAVAVAAASLPPQTAPSVN
ncbi:hypothetical protein AURDEDRAFT_126982 [Auricularia subglabra TFB-10046 SS5]|nr:hypothetical protein AURDEDRAFT_126982 [Auricularia subglabra TFB-10046 SS5]